MDYIQLLPGGATTGRFIGMVSPVESVIFVNKNGDRFVAEDKRRDVIADAILGSPTKVVFGIRDADGYTAMSCPAKYDCYETIGLSGTVEDIDPSVYAQFVALVQQAVNTAMNEGAAAKDAAKTAQAAMDAAQKGAAATQKERMSAEDAESAAALAAAKTQADITAAAASAASALGAANETLDACTAATQAANRAANLAPKKEERRLLMRLLREAAYQTRTADTLLDQLSGVWAEVPVEAVRLTRDSLTLYAGERTALGVQISPENATEQTVLWESSDEAVATVEDGVITAKTPGGTRITARDRGRGERRHRDGQEAGRCGHPRRQRREIRLLHRPGAGGRGAGGDRGPEPDHPDAEAGGDCGPDGHSQPGER